jgi:hypothetical protein
MARRVTWAIGLQFADVFSLESEGKEGSDWEESEKTCNGSNMQSLKAATAPKDKELRTFLTRSRPM